MSGRAEGTPTLFVFGLQWNLKNPARLRALFCFGGGGSKSNAIFTNLFKKNFVIILKVIYFKC